MRNIKLSLLFIPLIIVGCKNNSSVETLLNTAIQNAMVINKENIRELVCVNKSDKNIKWNDNNEQILVTTFHNYPDSYKEGSTITLSWGDSWVVSTKEFSNIYKNNKSSYSSDSLLRCKQILGMRNDSKNEWFSSYWISPSYLKRPAYITDITKQMDINFPSDTTKEYKNWFYAQAGYSYYSDKPAPWTRLGYTYDWASNKDRYGLTEFIIQDKTATVVVEKTLKVTDFLNYLEQL